MSAAAQFTDRATLTTDTSGQQRGTALVQIGLKYWLATDRVQLDGTCDKRIAGRGAAPFTAS